MRSAATRHRPSGSDQRAKSFVAFAPSSIGLTCLLCRIGRLRCLHVSPSHPFRPPRRRKLPRRQKPEQQTPAPEALVKAVMVMQLGRPKPLAKLTLCSPRRIARPPGSECQPATLRTQHPLTSPNHQPQPPPETTLTSPFSMREALIGPHAPQAKGLSAGPTSPTKLGNCPRFQKIPFATHTLTSATAFTAMITPQPPPTFILFSRCFVEALSARLRRFLLRAAVMASALKSW
ncbi:hypothetical protein EJ06DRAFT_370791 [Trichodelitschia bisporula]|uniref:Uncharacterized protein n=1 Tax=Trichodelitschia bisporula TaxID=703511 RepID=A0A6G1I1C6_9PEZI|nr:hypothetical protein EJ06DRAFT_370791 [Trichodelitschia bisporula]